VRQVQAGLVSQPSWKDRSPVTVADFASQALVGRLLFEAFPEDPWWARRIRLPCACRKNGQLDLVTRLLRLAASDTTSDRVCEWIDRGARNRAAASGRWTRSTAQGFRAATSARSPWP
jgi:3'(2'), 5'-bisphosphate nucleotidase